MKMIEDYYNRIMAMTEKSACIILELNISDIYNGEKSLEHKVGKL